MYPVVSAMGPRSFSDFEKYAGVNLNDIVDSIWRCESLEKSVKSIWLSTIVEETNEQ